MLQIFLAMAFADQPPSGTTLSKSDCAFSTKTTDDAEPPPGTVLLAGFQTGMTKATLSQAYPRLRRSRTLGDAELAPGIRGILTLEFSHKAHVLRALWFNGGRPSETYDALVRNFGKPGAQRLQGQFPNIPPGMKMDPRARDNDMFKWCLPTRDILMWKRSEDYQIEIEAPTH